MKQVKPSEINGVLSAPSSKSMMIRAAAASLLCEETSQIINPSHCDDCLAALHIIKTLGASAKKRNNQILIKGGMDFKNHHIDCMESGLCMRLFAPIAALSNREIWISGQKSLTKRPMDIVEEPLRTLGASCFTHNGFPPIQVKGPMSGGKVNVDGSLSSQFLSGLLMALPLCKQDSEVKVSNLKSKPYVEMTIALLKQFGIKIHSSQDLSYFFIPGNQKYIKTRYTVEGDWSGAAFLLTAGALKGTITVKNIDQDSYQADKKILEALTSLGAKVSLFPEQIHVQKNRLDPFEFDATECPDLFPPLVALASCCKGCSILTGVHRLRHKESNRAASLSSEFNKIGVSVSIKENRMEIKGSPFKGGTIDSHNDHRIAMAGAVAGLASQQGVKIKNWQVVSKSYPEFFKDLKLIGGKVT